MNTAPSSQYKLSDIIKLFTEAKQAQGLSKNTLIDYSRTYKKFRSFLNDDPNLNEISILNIRQFINAHSHLSKKTRLNIQIGLSSMWQWAVDEEICQTNIVRKIKRIKPEKRAIIPFSRVEIEHLFDSLDQASTRYKRDRAVLLVFLDTGMRATELCTLKIGDILGAKLKVYGKGDKERLLPISPTTQKAITDYLREQNREGFGPQEFIFLTCRDRAFRGDDLYHMVKKLGDASGIKAYPHKFRHTFAINFLRNGGNIYALQEMLGHESLEIVKRYLKIVEADIENVHRKASPVTNWNL